MAGVRVYVPSTLPLLADLLESGGVGPAPFGAQAATTELRAAWPEASEEEWEYAALTRAAEESVALLTDDDPPRRVVLAVDVPGATEGVDPADPTRVTVTEAVPIRLLASVHVDDAAAEDAVRALRDALAADDERALEVALDRCATHELAWYAAQEARSVLP